MDDKLPLHVRKTESIWSESKKNLRKFPDFNAVCNAALTVKDSVNSLCCVLDMSGADLATEGKHRTHFLARI